MSYKGELPFFSATEAAIKRDYTLLPLKVNILNGTCEPFERHSRLRGDLRDSAEYHLN